MHQAYIQAIGKFLPGEPLTNEQIETYLGQIGDRPSRVRQRILNRNGIRQRHYALDTQQQSRYRNSEMAAFAARDALSRANLEPEAIDLLACGTTLPDLLVPGFASMVHGELPELSPLEIASLQGVCCAGISALNYTVGQLQLSKRQRGLVIAAEFPSRLFKRRKFEAQTLTQTGGSLSFDTEFLRWMLSDGAGALLLHHQPRAHGLSLRVDWIELISHANAYPVCMYAGTDSAQATKSWLDYDSDVAAAEAGAMNLRQDIRLLGEVVKLGVEGWLGLIAAGRVRPEEIDWLLCHYSSHFFREQIVELLTQAGCMIPQEKWFTNLYTRGNTGCASIYLMLEELFYSGKLEPGQTLFCFVPESGRFTTAYVKLTVVGSGATAPRSLAEAPTAAPLDAAIAPAATPQADLLRQLTQVWLEFERQLRTVPLIRKLHRGEFTLEDYQALLRNLRPQVVEGARWIARAASNMTDFELRSALIGHAKDEHRDFQLLERNYVASGGELSEIVQAEKNLGSEALSAFMFHQASQENPVDLLGSMFIIEGLGQRLAGPWARQIQATLQLSDDQVSFLAYHGDNDESHLGKLEALLQADWLTPERAQRIVKTARITARLYRLQLEEIC